MQKLIIGICGGSGSGKTYFTKKLLKEFASDALAISLDSYYLNLTHLTVKEKETFNFDHPGAIDSELFIQDLEKLSQGRSIRPPIYDFTTSSRTGYALPIKSKPIIIVEGLFILCIEELAQKLDIKIFLEVDEHVRLKRRLIRDVEERGRTIESVLDKMNNFVFPMHNIHIEPYKNNADYVLKNNDTNLIQETERMYGIAKKRLHDKNTQYSFQKINFSN